MAIKGLKYQAFFDFQMFFHVLFHARVSFVGTRDFFVRQILRLMLAFMYLLREEAVL